MEKKSYIDWLQEVTTKCEKQNIVIPAYLNESMEDVFKAGFTPDEAIGGIDRRLVLGQHFENEGK